MHSLYAYCAYIYVLGEACRTSPHTSLWCWYSFHILVFLAYFVIAQSRMVLEGVRAAARMSRSNETESTVFNLL